jgi:serine protease Do
MRYSILGALVLLPLLATASFANECVFQPFNESFEQGLGFSSEESFGGGSYLGVDTRDVTPDQLRTLHLKEERGVEVTMVDQDAPAGKAGLKEHDVILSVNGTNVESVEQLRRMIHEIPAGRMISLDISRNGQPVTLKAQLADRKKTFGMPEDKDFKFAMPNIPSMPDMDLPVSIVVVHSSTRSGLMIENLTPQLGDFFGAKNGQGVLVRSVERGSRADKAGFRAGDVITHVNGESINDSGDFTHALRSRKDNKASITLLRDKVKKVITLSLPEGKQSGGIFNESFSVPEITGQTRIALREAQATVARLGPNLDSAISRLRLQAKEMERLKPQMENYRKEMREHEAEWKEEIQRSLEMQKRLRQEMIERISDI